jgi:hypothetical protein
MQPVSDRQTFEKRDVLRRAANVDGRYVGQTYALNTRDQGEDDK